MKRSILFILSLYLFSLSGLAAQIHFCDGAFESISLGYENSAECCCENGTKCKSCCKNKEFKSTVSNHFSAKQQVVNPLTLLAVQVIYNSERLIKEPLQDGEAFLCPPFKDHSLPVFIKNCVFRL